jgi:hypothetical protein
MSNQNNTIQTYQADSATLTNALGGLGDTLMRAAEENIRAGIEAAGGSASDYTALNMRAMVVTEALRLTTGLDLSTIIMRGRLIEQIEREGLTNVHPNGYANLTELAEQNGVSVGELSDIRTLVSVVFPFIQNELGMNLIEVWEQIGKSSFREMAPALRSLITGEQAGHTSVRNAVIALLDGAAASMIQEGADQEDLQTEEGRREVRAAAVRNLLTLGATMPTRQLRRQVRPSRVPPIRMTTMQVSEERWYAVMELGTEEQKDLALRVMNSHAENMMIDGRSEQAAEHRRLLNTFFGVRSDDDNE